MLPKYILSLENNKRAEMIAHKIGKIKNIDVATFNEGFDSESRNILINNLKKYNFFYHSNVVDIIFITMEVYLLFQNFPYYLKIFIYLKILQEVIHLQIKEFYILK